MHPQGHLKDIWSEFRAANPKLRIRDAAQQLGVSEAELVASGCGTTCLRLKPDWRNLLGALAGLGEVMALTRSDAVVHELTGHFTEPKFHADTALFFRPGLDTRYFLKHWQHLYAVNENGRQSLQVFDPQGSAVHKIYLTAASLQPAYATLLQNFRADDQSPDLRVVPAASKRSLPLADPRIDSQVLRTAWARMRDVHEGNRLIRQFGDNRRAVYRALGQEYAQLLAASVVEELLRSLAQQQQPLILFGINQGAVQCFAGQIQSLLQTGPWFNILDPGFNLHLRCTEIGEVWRIRKPSDDGHITTLDVFDESGNEIMLLAGHRSRGEPEDPQWRARLDSLPTLWP